MLTILTIAILKIIYKKFGNHLERRAQDCMVLLKLAFLLVSVLKIYVVHACYNVTALGLVL